VDFETSYRFEPNFFADQDESFSLRALVGYVSESSTTTAAGATQDAAGGTTRPKLTGVATATYGVGPWSWMLQARYFDHTKNNVLWVSGRDIDDNWIASQTTFNTALSYSGELKGGTAWRASFNVTNLFDRDPSVVAGANGQSVIAAQDTLGRRYQLSLNLDF
jgi:outer membrane receptor protein involved in Fe transport